ncbi:MAG: Dolichyl-phosphate-mannose-protein mannosyltransferase, partial [Actinomycetota bacterium]|nr:Dolichyl-phosphate-mannose-protein mannosyltransferase [Actinomycetota bacterium]
RSLSVVLTVALGCMIYWHVLRRWSSRRLAVIAVVLFATSPLGFQWFPTIKTYALSTLLLFTAYVWAESRSAGAWFVAGLFTGLAVDVRLLFAPVVIVFLVYARRDAWRFLVGLAVGLAPSIWLFVIGPGRFINDTLRAQTTRSHASVPSNVFGKVRTVGRVVVEPHFLLLVVVGVVLIAVCVRRRQRFPASVAIAATLAITNLVPTPSYAQYFVTLLPFLAVSAIELIQLLDISAYVREQRFLAIAAVILIIPAAWSFHVVTSADATELRISDAQAVARAVDRVASKGDVVLSFWPGFVYESGERQFPGLESDFAPFVLSNTHLSAGRAAEYHMLSTEAMKQAINRHAVRVIVFGKGAANQGVRWRQIMAVAGYRPVAKVRPGIVILALAG